MRNSSQSSARHLQASWRRELLQPLLISLAPLAYVATALDMPGDLSHLVVIFLMIGTACLPLIIPGHMVSGTKLDRPPPPREEGESIVLASPLQRVTDGEYGPKYAEDYESRIMLPEISSAPPTVQKLIATLGVPGPLHHLPRIVKSPLQSVYFAAVMGSFIAMLWWLHKAGVPNDQKLWT